FARTIALDFTCLTTFQLNNKSSHSASVGAFSVTTSNSSLVYCLHHLFVPIDHLLQKLVFSLVDADPIRQSLAIKYFSFALKYPVLLSYKQELKQFPKISHASV